MSTNDKAISALVELGMNCSRIGRGLELVAAVGAVYLVRRWWISGHSIELPFLKKSETETGTDAFICDGCNKKAVCPTCTQKDCAVYKQKPCSA